MGRNLLAIILTLAACGGDIFPVGADLPPRSADMATSPDMPAPRLEVKPDPYTGRPRLWDHLYGVPCQKQPLCETCSKTWDTNPQYCVPDKFWDTVIMALDNFPDTGFYPDAQCKQPLYVLYHSVAAQSSPRWAFDFREYALTSRVYPAKRSQATHFYQMVAGFCTANTPRQDSDYLQTYEPFERAGDPTTADQWVAWDEAEKVLKAAGGQP